MNKRIKSELIKKYIEVITMMRRVKRFNGRVICEQMKVNNVIPYVLVKMGILELDGRTFVWITDREDLYDIAIGVINAIRKRQRELSKIRAERNKKNQVMISEGNKQWDERDVDLISRCYYCEKEYKLSDLIWDFEKGRICEECLKRKDDTGILRLKKENKDLSNNKELRIKKAIELLKSEGFEIYGVYEVRRKRL